MACIYIMVNNAAVTKQLVAATAIARSNVKLGKAIGSATFWRTKKNIMPAIKMQLHNYNEKPNGEFDPESLFRKQAAELDLVLNDPKFQEELDVALMDFSLYYVKRLTEHYKNEEGKGPEIYVKRDDMNHFDAIAEVMTAKRMGRKSVVAAIRDAQLGVTTAVACAKYGLDCTMFMASYDIENQSSSVQLINCLGAQVKPVEGNLNNALVAARQEWMTGKLETTCYLTGTVVGRRPRPSDREEWGVKPDVVLGCTRTSSSDMPLVFHDFIQQQDVRLIRVLQPHSIGAEVEYTGEGLKLSPVKETGKVEFDTVADTEAVEAHDLLIKLEGIYLSKEASYAFAYLHKLCPTLPDDCKVVVVINC